MLKEDQAVSKFFLYICQLLVSFTILGFVKSVFIDLLYPYKLWAHYFFLTITFIVNVSFIIMYMGIRDSVKRALQTQITQERVMSQSVEYNEDENNRFTSHTNVSQLLAQKDLMKEYSNMLTNDKNTL